MSEKVSETERRLKDLARETHAAAIAETIHTSAAFGRAVAAVAHQSGWEASRARQFVQRALNPGSRS